MNMKEDALLQLYGKQLIKKIDSIIDPGLWNGKMGMAITFFHLFRITKKPEYEMLANDLIEEIYSSTSNSIPFHFADGLLGIGSGFEYIISKGFVEGNSDEILQEIDQITKNMIDCRPIDSLDIGKGVCGIGCYLYYRLKNKPKNDESMTTLKLEEYLIYLIDWIEELLLKEKKTTKYNDAYFLLCRLQKLDVFNYKVEKLITFCLQKMIDGNHRVQDHYGLLGIPSLKILEPWIDPMN